MTSTRTNLLLSLDVYYEGTTLESGWERIATTDRSSGLTAVAYRKGDQVVIAFRGFDELDPADAPDIARAYANRPFEQIGDAQEFVDVVLASNPGATVTLTGHSLGGGLAAIMAVRNGLKAETFAGIESVDAAYKSMDGYTYDPLGITLWDIDAASQNQDITQSELSTYSDVINRVVFGDIATYNDRTVPLTNHIGKDVVYSRIIKDGILEDDSRFGRYSNLTGDAFTSIVPSEVVQAPYTESFSTAIHALGFHALAITFNPALTPLWQSLPRLAFQLTNDRLATEADGTIGYRMTYDALDAMMREHLDTPAIETTTAEAMVGDWQKIAAAGERSTALSDADVNTALLQLSIQHAATQSLGDNPAFGSNGIVRVGDDYLQARIDDGGAWNDSIVPEGTRLIQKYAAWQLGATAALVGNQIAKANFLIVEAANGQSADIQSTTSDGDLLFGGRGNDKLGGAAGSDLLFGRVGGDSVSGGAGWDILAGGNGNDWLYGNSGRDILDGGRGEDIVRGALAADTFVFSTLQNGGAGDTIADYQEGVDGIALVRARFANIGDMGALSPDAFVEGAAAADANDRIIYDQATGTLWFDSDGTGGNDAVKLATLSGNVSLSADDFTII